MLQAEGEAQVITIINQQLRNNPTYLEWLKSTKWDGKLPLVTGGGGSGGQGVTPFIEIPTSRTEVENADKEPTPFGNTTTSGSGSISPTQTTTESCIWTIIVSQLHTIRANLKSSAFV